MSWPSLLLSVLRSVSDLLHPILIISHEKNLWCSPPLAILDGSTDVLLPPANSALLPPANLKATRCFSGPSTPGFDGFSGPSTQPDGDSGQGPFLLIAAKFNPGRALH